MRAVRASAAAIFFSSISLAAPARAASERPTAVVIITIDTLRHDHLPVYGYPRPTAPFLTKLAKRGVVYLRAFSAISHTAPSHASLFTSLFPLQNGVMMNGEMLPHGIPTMAEMFAAAGYRTSAFGGARFLEGLTRGFREVDLGSGPARHAEETTAFALDWVDSGPEDQKVFIWLHFYDVHQYAFPDPIYDDDQSQVDQNDHMEDAEITEYAVREQGVTPDAVKNPNEPWFPHFLSYDGRIHYVDRQIEWFYNAMEKRFPGQVLWVITADHGEGLGCHDYTGHGRAIHQEQLHVPLIVVFPHRRFSGRTCDDLVRLVDIFPTLATMIGRPLFTDHVGEVIWPIGEKRDPNFRSFAQRRFYEGNKSQPQGDMYALQDAHAKYIWAPEEGDEFYDLVKDPLEQVNTAGAHSPEAEAMKKDLISMVERMQGRAVEESTIDPSAVEELKALGY